MKGKVFVCALSLVVMFFMSCGTQKQAVAQSQKKSASPFGEVYSMPCEVYDTPQKFTATGIYRGSSYQKGECQLNALENAKQMIYAKYHHTYNGMISNYRGSIGNNRGNDIETKLQRAGDQVVEAILNDISATCIKFSNVADDGNVECYVAIEVFKDELADKVSKKVADVLTQEEKERINFNEYNYRKQMEDRMKNYKEDKNN